MKYKFLAYIPAVAATLLSLSSCSEGFLDNEMDGGYITPDQLTKASKWNPKVLLGQTQGVTTSLIRYQAGGSTHQSDFGQKSVDIATDIITHDMVFSRGSTYGYYRLEAQGTATDKANSTTTWYTYYKVIDACNFTFGTLGSDEVEPEDADNKLYYAEAKAARAFAYYNLLTLFTGDYAEYKDKKVLPVYRGQSGTYHAPQVTSDVYQQVFTDCDQAIAAFENAKAAGLTPSIDQPSEAVAYTIKAYAYLQMGEYAKAKEAADKAIETSGKQILPKADLYYGFNTVNNDNWMWGVDITADNTGALCTFWGMMDLYTYSYVYAGDWKVINSDLFQQVPEWDGRRDWFTTSPYYVYYYNRFGATALLPTGKFHSDRSTSVGGDRNWESDIHFMRVEECYLIAAEAEARLGNLSSASTYLKAILENRVNPQLAPSDSPANATEEEMKAWQEDEDRKEALRNKAENDINALASMNQEQLLDEIFFNWRVEMWGEGKTLRTIKRFHKDIACPANDGYTEQGVISGTSPKLVFQIPNQELQYNPAMKDADQ